MVYVNDMFRLSRLLHFIIFADDTNTFHLNKDPEVLINVTNREVLKLSKWFMVNKLFLNVMKSNFMVFGRKETKFNSIVLKWYSFRRDKMYKILERYN